MTLVQTAERGKCPGLGVTSGLFRRNKVFLRQYGLNPIMLTFFNRIICQKVNGRTCANRNVVIHCSQQRKKDVKETNSDE